MSICQNLTLPNIPQLPFILAPNPLFIVNTSLGTPGVSCCAYTIPISQFIPPIPIPDFAQAMMAALTAFEIEMQLALTVLDQIHIPVCAL